MTRHLQREIERLKKLILSVGTMVEESLRNSVLALSRRDPELAKKVIRGDSEIDLLEVEVEEECLKILALYQPVAIDLRFIISVLKINNDLERIGDLASNIAKRANALAVKQPIPIPQSIPQMTEIVQSMLKDSLDSLVNIDNKLAENVCKADDKVDQIHSAMYQKVQELITSDVENIDLYIQLLGISRYLERAADHMTNIAEDVIYMIGGEIHRHVSGDLT
ncbi:MAG: phosphate signaling complex protein PhoU [Fidelibacterota bacterium]